MRNLLKYPTTKQILLLAGMGVFVAGTLVAPQLPRLFRYTKIDFEKFLEEDEWDKFNKARLRQRLKELHKQKVIKIYQVDDKYAVQITNKGKKKWLKYKLDDLEIPKQNQWDGRWRIVVYDIPENKKSARDALRQLLKRLEFYELQKSVYLYPYPCSEAIEFLREFYDIGEYVTLLIVGSLEGQEAYKKYFDL